MVLVQNKGEKPITLYFQGKEYILALDDIIEIPEVVAKLYFCYNDDNINTDKIHWCCERLRNANSFLANLSDKDIWDNIISKIIFNVEIIKPKKTKQG